MTDGWPGVEFAPPPPVTSDYAERIRNTRRNIEVMDGILSKEEQDERRRNLETVELLHEAYLRGQEAVGILIALGLEAANEGLAEFPDRLATSYRIADKARSIMEMAQQLVVAENLYESQDISDSDLGDIEKTLIEVEMSMEFGEPQNHDHAKCEDIVRRAFSRYEAEDFAGR